MKRGTYARVAAPLVLIMIGLAVPKYSMYLMAVIFLASPTVGYGHPTWLMPWLCGSLLLATAATGVDALNKLRGVGSNDSPTGISTLAREINAPREWLRRLASLIVIPLSAYTLMHHGWPDMLAYLAAIVGWCCHDLSILLTYPFRRWIYQLRQPAA